MLIENLLETLFFIEIMYFSLPFVGIMAEKRIEVK